MALCVVSSAYVLEGGARALSAVASPAFLRRWRYAQMFSQ